MADSLTFVRVVQVVDRAAGALVVYSANSSRRGNSVKVTEVGNQKAQYYAQMKEFTSDNGTHVYAAIFPRLPQANYDIEYNKYWEWGRTTVFAGTVVAFEEK
ncbi:MAG TPA: hypothetical protein VF116_16570 [Ktedonobacterales bacterium]